MTIWHSIFLGILQGVTEFLPISSSGHLVIMERWMYLDVADNHLFDVVLHAGTLLALLVYFWRDWVRLIASLFSRDTQSHHEIGYLILATIPAAIIGILFGDFIDAVFRSTTWIGIWFIVTGLLLFIAEKAPKKNSTINTRRAFLIGCVQAIAIIPGISRSGSTISAGMLQGMSREHAARFSFMMAVPVLIGATILTVIDLQSEAIRITSFNTMLVGFTASAIVSFVVIRWLLAYIKNHSLAVFSWYLFVVGTSVLLLSVIQ